MELNDKIFIAAPMAQVYEALNDPEVLKACIPGCEELIKHSNTELEAKVVSKVGPVKAKFTGNVTLDQSGAAGFARGAADVTLTEHDDGTMLTYTAKAEIGGKLAQLGSRLIVGTAKKLASKFFVKFSELAGTTVS